jgi:hypothetical protein
MKTTKTLRVLVACGVFFGASFAIFVPAAEAIIGRPLTPLSYAGVARRTTRRAVAVGAAAAATPYGYGYPGVYW